MKGYKAFKKGLVCRGKQYAENTVFEEESAVVCRSGMHFCKDPLAVLDYYPLVNNDGEMSEFAEVEALDTSVTDDGQKYCTKKLKIGAKLSFAQLVQASVNFEYESIKETKTKTTAKDSAQIGSSGDSAQIGSWITLAEWKFIDNVYTPVCVKTEKVDGERIKEDTFYKLIDGEFTEIKD